jgi:hypothetical protein
MEIFHDKIISVHLEECCMGYCSETRREVCSDFQVDLVINPRVTPRLQIRVSLVT